MKPEERVGCRQINPGTMDLSIYKEIARVGSCGLSKHKNGFNFETGSNKTHVRTNFPLLSCLLLAAQLPPAYRDTPYILLHKRLKRISLNHATRNHLVNSLTKENKIAI